MDPIQNKGRAGCSIKAPQGWTVQAFPGSIVLVGSPDGEAFSLVEFITGPASQKPVSEILGKGLFHSTSFFPKAKRPEIAAPESADSAAGFVQYITPRGLPGRAHLTCLKKGGNVLLLAYAAPETLFAQVEPLLRSILDLSEPSAAPVARPVPSLPQQLQQQPVLQQPALVLPAFFGQPQPQIPGLDEPKANPWTAKSADKAFNNMDAYIRDDPPKAEGAAHVPVAKPAQPLPSPAPPPPPPPVPPQHQLRPAQQPTQQQPAQHPQAQHPQAAPQHQAPSPYSRYTEPEKGTYTVEVPHGWRVNGGFNHPMPGDRRPWIEAASPDGIYIACEPGFPQSFCHFRDQPEGHPATLAAGGQLLNLKPSAQRLNDFYLENVASRYFGPLQLQQRRPRPDMVNLLKTQFQQYGTPVGGKWQITSDEMLFNVNRDGRPFVVSILSTAAFNGEYNMMTWAFWDANVYVYIAPPQLAARAEEVRTHMKTSIHFTPALIQIYQQDEAKIAAAGRQAHVAQQNWFTQQQSIHNAQTAFGDSIVANYWRNR
jgi:hypothetical protein